jgi:hypothetical protein
MAWLPANARRRETCASAARGSSLTGDGPWYRYLVDLLLVSPIVLILALGTIFRLNCTMKPELFMSIFIAASYLVMCNVKYGMNLRYANMWDLPLRFLAFSEIVALASWAKKYRGAIIAAAVALLAAIEFHRTSSWQCATRSTNLSRTICWRRFRS